MTATAIPPARRGDPARLTFRYTQNPDGWVTAQIEEFPAAISQGASEHEAYVNVLDALHDLTHEPSLAERIAFATQARLDDLYEGFLEPLGRRAFETRSSAIRDLGRDRVH